jgi:hypothetical protein
VSIYLPLTAAGKPAEVSIGRECEPGQWNAAAGRVFGIKETVKSLNRYLDSLQVKVYEAHQQLEAEGVIISTEALKSKLTGREGGGKLLIEIFKEHNRKMAALVGQEFVQETLERYSTSLKLTVDFLE